jgi:hypothetical protein
MLYKANCLRYLERFEEAIQIFDHILQIDMKMNSEPSPEIAQRAISYAICLANYAYKHNPEHINDKQLQQAKIIGKRGIEILQKTLGKDHPITLKAKLPILITKIPKKQDVSVMFDES